VTGEIRLDLFEAYGDSLDEEKVSPFFSRAVYIYPSPVKWKGEVQTYLFRTPEEKNKIYHWLNLKMDATVTRNYFVEAEIASAAQNC